MNVDLKKLNVALEFLAEQRTFARTIELLSEDIKGIPNEFLPQKENMVVVSFHTCGTTELEGVDCETGAKRVYEGRSDRLHKQVSWNDRRSDYSDFARLR